MGCVPVLVYVAAHPPQIIYMQLNKPARNSPEIRMHGSSFSQTIDMPQTPNNSGAVKSV
jgi:hypothetical protein